MTMKRLFFAVTGLFMMANAFAQSTEKVTNKNSWLKAGLSAGVPVGNIANSSSFAAGLDLSGQWMATPNLGLGIATGYTHYFAKNNNTDFGTVPLGALIHYYPQSAGFFAGTDIGYSFITNSAETGGLYIKPKIGYHNYDWNLFGFYNHVFANTTDVQNLGVGVVYNLRFN
jgi:hypothetical protein